MSEYEASSLPDKVLQFAIGLPAPLNGLCYRPARMFFQFLGRHTKALARISFGSCKLTVPLAHPAVYWRYRPPAFNLNYVTVAKAATGASGGMIIDVGANVGDGVALLRSFATERPIMAIEGTEEWFEFLHHNCAGMKDVILRKIFLGPPETLNGQKLVVSNGSARLMATRDSDADAVTVATLDAVWKDAGSPSVSLLKTDTDGFDFKVVSGASELLKSQQPVVFSEIDECLLQGQGNSAAQFLSFLQEHGYSHLSVWNNFGRWLGDRPITQGIADLLQQNPGGTGMPFLDIAALTPAHEGILPLLCVPASPRTNWAG